MASVFVAYANLISAEEISLTKNKYQFLIVTLKEEENILCF